jgi:hypothetical protein
MAEAPSDPKPTANANPETNCLMVFIIVDLL